MLELLYSVVQASLYKTSVLTVLPCETFICEVPLTSRSVELIAWEGSKGFNPSPDTSMKINFLYIMYEYYISVCTLILMVHIFEHKFYFVELNYLGK